MAPPLAAPDRDPAPLFELFRGNHATELLTAAVAHLRAFEQFRDGPISLTDLGARLGLAARPLTVLTTGLRAMGLLTAPAPGALNLTPLAAAHLVAGAPFDVTGYVGLAADTPGVLALVKSLRADKPPAPAFIYREGAATPMEDEATARGLTLALAGRARVCAPALAAAAPLAGVKVLLDVGGGTGLYSIACLERYPDLRAVVWDRPEVLKVAAELADRHGVADRLACVPGDMFADPVPAGADAVLLSNVLHDWDAPRCRALVGRLAAALPAGGVLLVHDVFLNDALDGPLPVALYSVALFQLTEGRAYSAAEYRGWLAEAGLTPGAVAPTLVHCGVLPATKA